MPEGLIDISWYLSMLARNSARAVLLAAAAAFVVVASPSQAADPAAAPTAIGSREEPKTGAWSLEHVKMADGHEFHGLVADDRGRELEFVEVIQPPGRPMYLVVRPLDAAKVSERRRL